MTSSPSFRAATSAVAVATMMGLAACTPVEATTPQGSSPQGPLYVSVGDSYSTGLGGGVSDPARCHHSSTSFPGLLGKKRGWNTTQVACPGAITWTMTGTQLHALSNKTDRVTITIGGNDVLLSTGNVPCAGNEAFCKEKRLAGQRYAKGAFVNSIRMAYRAVQNAAPKAKIAVVGYPRIFGPDTSCLTPAVTLSSRGAKEANLLTSTINEVLQEQAASVGFTFVSVEKVFAGHGTCTSSPFILGHDPAHPEAILHPTRAGQSAYAKAVAAQWK